jgi:hypothetical protein
MWRNFTATSRATLQNTQDVLSKCALSFRATGNGVQAKMQDVVPAINAAASRET